MKFYDREAEMEILKRSYTMSKKNSAFTVITGRRRMGKTALIMESEKGEKFLYFFVPRKNEVLLCEELVTAARTDLGIELIDSGRFGDIFKQLMMYGMETHYTLILDEFQNLERINKSIKSEIQNYWDQYKSRAKINLIVCGSVYSMMIKIFQNYKEPLWGRATSQFRLDPFRPSVVKTILKDHNPHYEKEDLLFLYAVTGGVPKYIEALMDNDATTLDKMLNFICVPESLFIREGEVLLVSEFGKEYGTYFAILDLIAGGKNTLGEINAATGKESGPYLDNLEKEYGLIRRSKPMFSPKSSRGIRWQISDNYLKFYFRFISRNQSLIEMKRFDLLKERIKDEYTQYSGTVLEDYFREKLIEEADITNIGSHWDRKGQNEIDIIMLNDFSMKATVIEIKRDPNKADIRDLMEKAGSIAELKEFDVDYRVLSLDDM